MAPAMARRARRRSRRSCAARRDRSSLAVDPSRRDRLLGAREEHRGRRAGPRSEVCTSSVGARCIRPYRACVGPLRRSRAGLPLALGINALVMSLAAIPAYLLARMFVGRRSALLVALFTVLVPSMSYTGVVMTENAFYPIFLLSALLIARAVRRRRAHEPGARPARSLRLLAFTRIQGVALAAHTSWQRSVRLTGSRSAPASATSAGSPDGRARPARVADASAPRSRVVTARSAGSVFAPARSTCSTRGDPGVVRVPDRRPRPLRRRRPVAARS